MWSDQFELIINQPVVYYSVTWGWPILPAEPVGQEVSTKQQQNACWQEVWSPDFKTKLQSTRWKVWCFNVKLIFKMIHTLLNDSISWFCIMSGIIRLTPLISLFDVSNYEHLRCFALLLFWHSLTWFSQSHVPTADLSFTRWLLITMTVTSEAANNETALICYCLV